MLLVICRPIIIIILCYHCSYKRTHKMVEEPHCCFNNQPFFKSTTQQICEFLILLNLLLSLSLLASSPASQTSVRSTKYFPWSVLGWHTSVSIPYSGRWLGLGGTDPTKVRPTSLYSPTRWYLQFYCRTFQSSHVSIFIGHICTFYLSIKIQVPDHMWKRGDQWRLHQSPSWPGEIYSQTSALHIQIKTIIYLL